MVTPLPGAAVTVLPIGFSSVFPLCLQQVSGGARLLRVLICVAYLDRGWGCHQLNGESFVHCPESVVLSFWKIF